MANHSPSTHLHLIKQYNPKDHWTLKTGYFEDPTPAIQVQTLPLEGPRSLGKADFEQQTPCKGERITTRVGVKTWYENPDPILWHMKFRAAAYMKLNVWT